MPSSESDSFGGVTAVHARLGFLKAAQNPDGGWGYFPGKKSWLEPTVYAGLALHGDPAADRAWELVSRWQLPSGAWKPAAEVIEESWATALVLTWARVRGASDARLSRALAWLLDTRGAEGPAPWYVRLFSKGESELDPSLKGWPWRPSNASWVEPTAHALVALKKSRLPAAPEGLEKRVESAEKMLLDRRCVDRGWNYGNRRVLATDLESYPETTAVALVGLHGTRRFDLEPSRKCALAHWRARVSPLARAWLRIALRVHGLAFDEMALPETPARDVMLAALEAIGASERDWKLFMAEAA